MSRFTTVGRKLDLKFGDDINANFTKSDEELTRIESERVTRDNELQSTIETKETESINRDDALQADINSKDSAAHSRMTQIEQDSITRDKTIETTIATKETESVQRDNNLTTRIDNIVANSGSQNTEIVDGRLGADNVARANIGTLLREVHKEQLAANKKTETITHGMHILNTLKDIASSINVEFYGQTLVNLLGKKGDCESTSPFTLTTGGSISLDTSNKIQGNSSVKISGTTSFKGIPITLSVGKQYLAIAYIKTSGGEITYGQLQIRNGTTNNSKASNVIKSPNFTLAYVKFTAEITDTSVGFVLNAENVDSFILVDAIRIYEISTDTYNKIGVSLLDADVEKMFPYVNGVAHVKNPVLLAEGSNLLPPFSEWTLHANATVKSPYELELVSNTVSSKVSSVIINAVESSNYVLSLTTNGKSYVRFLDGANNYIGTTKYGNNQILFTTPIGAKKIEVSVYCDVTGTFTFSQPMLNVGTTIRPFVPRNTSFLYCHDVTLAGIEGNKKDILYKNFDKGRWEKTKWWETDVVLDGSFTVGNRTQASTTGYKGVFVADVLTQVLDSTDATVINHKSESLKVAPKYTEPLNGSFRIGAGNKYVYASIPNTDSGWTEAMTPTADLIKSYFNGYRYTGDGTTHSWVSLVDGSVPPTNTLAYVSTTMATGFTPYKLTYQLASPVVEEVKVEGDLVVNSATQITIGSEFTYTTDDKGNRTYTITPTSQRTGANLTEVKVQYDSNFKSSYDSTVTKVSDLATDNTIFKRNMLLVYARLDALENGGV